MFDIDLQSSLAAEDPDTTAQIKDNRPAIAPLTGVPNRYTIFVPSEKTTFSLGEKCPEEDRINDVGVTARTNNHIHFHVAKEHKTIVSLGGPATTVTGKLTVDSHDPKVPSESVGYSMVTDDVAWHDAKKQQYLVSRTADIVVRTVGPAEEGSFGPFALLQSDFGSTTIGAGKAVTIGGKSNISIIAASAVDMETDEKYDTSVGTKMLKFKKESWLKWGTEFVDWVSSTYSLFSSTAAIFHEAPGWKNKGKWVKENRLDFASLLIDCYKWYDGGKGLLQGAGLLPESEGPPKVEISAEGGVDAITPAKVSIFGGEGVGIASAFTVDMVGATAGVKGFAYAGMWAGLTASVTGLVNTTIEAKKGIAKLTGAKEVIVASEKILKVAGKTDAQFTADEGQAMLHGKKSMYIAGGAATSYGMLSDDKGLHLGKFSSGDNLGAPGKVRDEGFSADSKVLGARFKGSEFQMKDSKEIRMKTGKIKLNADSGNVTVKGTKVLLG